MYLCFAQRVSFQIKFKLIDWDNNTRRADHVRISEYTREVQI